MKSKKIKRIILMMVMIVLLSTILASSSRLPIVNDDLNNWGTILNDFLSVSHTDNGTHENLTVTGWFKADWIKGKFNITTDDNIVNFNGTHLGFNRTEFNRSMLEFTASIIYNATSIDLFDGTLDSGNINSIISLNDRNSYNISELNNLDWEIFINFTTILNFDGIILKVWYEGYDDKGHNVDICLWDWITSSWDCEYHRDISYTTSWEVLTPAVLDPISHIGTGVNQGEVRLLLQHDNKGDKGRNTHKFYVDYAVLIDGFSALTTTAPPTLQEVVDANPNLNSNIISSANFTAGVGMFNRTFNKSEQLGYANVRIGAYSGAVGWATMVFETVFTTDTNWVIDNGGAGIRIYESTPSADQFARFRINSTAITIGEIAFGRRLDYVVTGDTFMNGNCTVGLPSAPRNMTMFSPDGTQWSCGIANNGTWVCS